jgi:hypothetical protein
MDREGHGCHECHEGGVSLIGVGETKRYVLSKCLEIESGLSRNAIEDCLMLLGDFSAIHFWKRNPDDFIPLLLATVKLDRLSLIINCTDSTSLHH